MLAMIPNARPELRREWGARAMRVAPPVLCFIV